MINIKMLVRRSALPALLATMLAGCTFPGVYKLEVQQGNIVTQDMVNQLQPGMSRAQVRYILGTPLLTDSFTNDRWDYFYSLKDGEGEYSKERLTLVFAGDSLVSLQGNFRPGGSRQINAVHAVSDSRGLQAPQVFPIEDSRIPQ